MSIDSDGVPTPSSGSEDRTCPICESTALHRRHCKTVCDRCGYVESCEDNFVPIDENPEGRGETIAA